MDDLITEAAAPLACDPRRALRRRRFRKTLPLAHKNQRTARGIAVRGGPIGQYDGRRLRAVARAQGDFGPRRSEIAAVAPEHAGGVFLH
jgi:hypothetical protein